MTHKTLIVDDDSGVLSALKMLLKSEGFSPTTVESKQQALDTLRHRDFNLILMDLNYSKDTTSGEEGLQLIRAIRKVDDIIPIVVMTGWGTIDIAVQSMKQGANDFIQKPWENERLLAILRNQAKLSEVQKHSQKLSRHNQLLEGEIEAKGNPIGNSDTIKDTMDTLLQVADTEANVLLTGENGTGKSMFARFLHENSSRREASFVSVNMGAVTESLFESEMFGHIKGAFTDAKSTRIGRFELADEGSLFLDEIANTPSSQQRKLLRVLEDYQFEKIGSRKTQTSDFRLISATNTDLTAAVTAGDFRKDLYFRIKTVQIEIPPLRQRKDDIIPLAEAFLAQAARKYAKPAPVLSTSAKAELCTYSWPGNVRELSNVMERAYILCKASSIHNTNLGLEPALDGNANPKASSCKENALKPLHEVEADEINARLAHFEGNTTKAAESLGMSRSTFYRRLSKSRM